MGFALQRDGRQMTVSISGDFIRYQAAGEAARLVRRIQKASPAIVILEDKGIGRWDSSLLVVLYQIVRAARVAGITIRKQTLPDGLQRLIDLAFSVDRKPSRTNRVRSGFIIRVGEAGIRVAASIRRGIDFCRQTIISVGRWVRGKAVMRRVDFWFALDDCAPKAVGIVSLISFMVGLILAFVGAVQLKSFGAQIYVASLVTIGMTRIMGAIMVGIIMAGRTGASYAATIGTMQVNEELDALQTMGISRTDFLVLPRLFALVLAMPFLALLADIMGMVGGAAVGVFMLGISPSEYIHYSMEAFNLTNFFVGVFHGLVFGFVIALCGCYFGIHSGRNADSVGVATTRAVVYAIVWMIVMTGIITLVCEVLGI